MNTNYCQTKVCPKCKLPCDLMDYSQDNKRTNKLQIYCKICQRLINNESHKKNREKRLKYKSNRHVTRYGITKDDYNKMLVAQDNKCAICKKHQSTFKTNLCVDHLHSLRGKESVRGLICAPCNKALGMVSESIEVLESTIVYLKKYNSIQKPLLDKPQK